MLNPFENPLPALISFLMLSFACFSVTTWVWLGLRRRKPAGHWINTWDRASTFFVQMGGLVLLLVFAYQIYMAFYTWNRNYDTSPADGRIGEMVLGFLLLGVFTGAAIIVGWKRWRQSIGGRIASSVILLFGFFRIAFDVMVLLPQERQMQPGEFDSIASIPALYFLRWLAEIALFLLIVTLIFWGLRERGHADTFQSENVLDSDIE